MNIVYMWNLEANPQLDKEFPRESWTEEQIQELEQKYNEGSPFPRAFREYLYLAGGYGGTGVVYEDWDELREDCNFDMEGDLLHMVELSCSEEQVHE